MPSHALHTRSADPLVIAPGSALDGAWQSAGQPNANPRLVAVLHGDFDADVVASKMLEQMPDGAWKAQPNGTVVGQCPSSQRNYMATCATRASGGSASVDTTPATAFSAEMFASHAKTGAPCSAFKGLLRLAPGAWSVVVSDDGNTVTLTRR